MRPHLFLWQRHVAVLAESKAHPFDGPRAAPLLAFSIVFSLTCKGTTGRGCWLAPEVLELVPRRTANRYLAALVDAGLTYQTQTPARGRLGKPGRSARYDLSLPGNVGHDGAEDWPAFAVHELAHVVRGPWPSDADGSRTTWASAEHDRVPVRRSTRLALLENAS